MSDEVRTRSGPAPLFQRRHEPSAQVALTVDDITALRAVGETPRDYAALVLPVQNGGMGMADVNGQRMLVFQAQVLVPPGLLPPDASSILDPTTGQPRLSERLAKAIPNLPWMLRVVIKRSALSDSARDGLRRVDEQVDAQNALDFEALVGRPPVEGA